MSDCPGMNHIGTQDTIPHRTRQNILHKPDKVSDFLGNKNFTVSLTLKMLQYWRALSHQK